MTTLDLSNGELIKWLQNNTNASVDGIEDPTDLDLTSLELKNNDLNLEQYTELNLSHNALAHTGYAIRGMPKSNDNVIPQVLVPLLNLFPKVTVIKLQGNRIGYALDNLANYKEQWPGITTVHVSNEDIKLSDDGHTFIEMFPDCQDLYIHGANTAIKNKYGYGDDDGQNNDQEKNIRYQNKYNVHFCDYSSGSPWHKNKNQLGPILFKMFLFTGVMSGIGSLVGLGVHNFPDHITGIPLDKLNNPVQKSAIVFAVFSFALALAWYLRKGFKSMAQSDHRGKKIIGELGLIGIGAGLGATLGSFITLPDAFSSNHHLLNSVQLGVVYGAAFMVGFYLLKQICCCPSMSSAANSGHENDGDVGVPNPNREIRL